MFNFLQIHDDRPFTDWEKKCISQLKSIMDKDDTYMMFPIPHFDNLTDTVNYSDKIRFELLSINKNGVYVDTDCFLKYRFIPQKHNIPLFSRNSNNKYGVDILDVFLIYVNNNTEFIKRNFSQSARSLWIENNVAEKLRKEFYGWPLDLCKKMSGYELIPDSVYIHKYQSIQSESLRRKKLERKLHDVVNDFLVGIDSQRTMEKNFVVGMKNDIERLSGVIEKITKENEKLKKEISDYKDAMIKLLPVNSSQQNNVTNPNGGK